MKKSVALTQAQSEEELQQSQKELARLTDLARNLLDNPAVLHDAVHAVEDLGVVGERKNIALVHLLVRSRALSRPINLEINSPSSSGKTFLANSVLQLEDPTAYYEMTAGSERALVYLNEPLEHRILYVQEPEGLATGVGAAALKSLVWDGRLRYDTVVKEEGDLVGKHIEKNGPTGLLVCTTQPLEDQIANRLLRIEANSSNEQTRRILQGIASRAEGDCPALNLKPWHAMSKVLGKAEDIHILFARFLSEKISATSLRIRRDFRHLLSFVAASAVEHSYQRQRDQAGYLLATVADYAHAHVLLNEIFRSTQADSITAADRDMVAAVEALSTLPGGSPGGKPITQAELRSLLELSKSTASYRVGRLLEMGYLINREWRKGQPMQLVMGDSLPDEALPLPSPCEIARHLVESGRPDLIVPWMNPVTGEVHDCRTHLEGIDWRSFPLPFTGTLEPCLRCKAAINVPDQGFTPAEPPEPVAAGVQRFKEVQAKLNPSTPSVGSKLSESGGSTGGGKEPGDENVHSPAQTFVPTAEWQEIAEGVTVPPGLEIRMDLATGRNYARLGKTQLAAERVQC
jgi:hypothetical protein